MLLSFLLLGLVNWLITIILVQSELTRPVRNWVDRRYKKAGHRWSNTLRRRHAFIEELWFKLRYLVGCHLCTGTWVGLVMGAALPLHLAVSGWPGRLLAGLAFKAVGHFTLEIVGRLQHRPSRSSTPTAPERSASQ